MGTINANLSGIIMEPKQKLAEQKKENNKIIYMLIKKHVIKRIVKCCNYLN